MAPEAAIKQRDRRVRRRALRMIDSGRYDVWETTGDFDFLVFNRRNRREYRVIRLEPAGDLTPAERLSVPPGVASAERWVYDKGKRGFRSVLIRGTTGQEQQLR